MAMMKDGELDITLSQREQFQRLLSHYLPDTVIWAYGSRVTGHSQPSSDLDLVAFTRQSQSAAISQLREALEESSLPFRVDLFVWGQIPESFKAKIMSAYIVIQDKT